MPTPLATRFTTRFTTRLTTPWIKLLRDVQDAPGRFVMIVAALAASIAGVVTMLSTYQVLTREVPRNYQQTNPASAQLEVSTELNDSLLQRVRRFPNVRMATRAAAVGGRLQAANGTWVPMRLFVVERFDADSISTVSPEAGAWPAPVGGMLIERSALDLTGKSIGASVTVDIGGVGRRTVPMAGTVHDPAVAPAWQEQTVYGYVERTTLATLGVDVPLDIVKLVVRDSANDAAAIERSARGVVAMLSEAGVEVHELRVPPPRRHPHQGQMNAVIEMLLLFSMLALALGALLTATIIGGLLAQQLRQIAIMKTIGATSRQITTMYVTLVAALSCAALLLGLPAGLLMGREFVSVTAQLLNLRIASNSLPWWTYAGTLAVGIALPVLTALVPIIVGARRTVRQALDAGGTMTSTSAQSVLDRVVRRLPFTSPAVVLAFRNAVRRRGRLVLTIVPLAGAGAMCITSLNLRAAWEGTVDASARGRSYDLELGFAHDVSADTVATMLAALPAVARVESWGKARATVADTQRIALSHAYPDGAHGGFALRGAPVDTRLIRHEMLSGRWLTDADTVAGATGAVINSVAAKGPFYGRRVGDVVELQVDERAVALRIVGITKELLTPGAVYAHPAAFARVTQRQASTRQASTPQASTNAVRVRFADAARSAATDEASTREILAALERAGLEVSSVVTESRFSVAQGGHVYILIVALVLIALIMTVVGLLGLSSSLGVSVIERTRELGVMRAIGATGSSIRRMIVIEGLLVAGLSAGVAIASAIPLSAVVGGVIASVAAQELVLQLSPFATALWLIVVSSGAIVVSLWPAAKAARMTIRQTFVVN